MKRCSFCEWIPMLPWPVWPLAGQCGLGQNVVVGSMLVLQVTLGNVPLRTLPGFVANFTQNVMQGQLPLSVEEIRRFCRKFSFEALCGMIFLDDQPCIIEEHDDGDQF